MAFTKVAPAGIGSTPGDGYRIGDSFLHSTGVDITNINATGIVTATSLDISGDIDFDGHTNLDNVSIAGVTTHSDQINMLDNKIIRFGTAAASRTSIYYDSSDSNTWIKNFNDTLKIGYRPVEIYYVNQKRLEFINGGNRFTTDVSTTFLGDNYHASWSPGSNRFQLNDNAKLAFGSQADTNIFHNNSHLYIQNTTGNINVTGNVDVTGNIDSTVAGGDNTLKIQTTSSGDPKLQFNAAGSGGHDIFYNRSTNELTFKSAGGSDRLKIAANGDLLPATDSQYNIGSNAVRFANIYADTLYGDGSNLTGITQTTINNNANNRLITGSGTANTLTGETRLTFDGNSLDISGSGSHPFSVGGGDYRNLVITGNSQSSSGFIYLGNGAATNNADFDLGRIRIYNGATQVVQIAGSTDTSANDDGRLVFATRNTGGSLQERLRITSTGLLLGGSDAQGNTTLGGNAGDSFSGTSAIQNTLIGYDAGTAITSGDQNVALGYNSLKSLTSDTACTAIGAYALEDSTGGGNTGVGYAALQDVSTGNNNTALGFGAGQNIQAGLHNIAIGRDAMKAASNNSSSYNVVIGSYCANQSTQLYNNVIMGYGSMTEYTGTNPRHSNVCIGHGVAAKFGQYSSQNVVLGFNAMNGSSSTVANMESLTNNIVIGTYALRNAKTNTNNCIVMGQEAAENAATGSGTYSNWTHNISIGYRSCRQATGGSDSITAIGSNALEHHTGDGDGSSGGYIVAIGNNALQQARHPRHSVAVGNAAGTVWNPAKSAQHEGGCVFIGGGAGRTIVTGTSTIAIGRDAMAGGPSTGNHITAIGARCFESNTSGGNNCAVGGLYTGLMVTTGSYNNFFGSLAGYAYDTTNATKTGDHNNIFGGYSRSSGSNNDHENIFGGGLTGKGADTTYIKGAVYNSNNSSSFSTTSDERIKKNIVDNNIGLDAIEKIRVRNFEFRTKNEITDFDNPEAVVVRDREGIQLGVIAQEIKEILPDVVKQNTTGAYAVDPDNITWYLVNAVKELSAEVKSLKAQLNS